MGGASDQIFVFKALTSSIGLLASDLLLQGFELLDRVIRVRHSFTRLSPPRVEAFIWDYLLIQGFELNAWFFASGLLLQGFHLLDRKSDASCNSLRRYTFG